MNFGLLGFSAAIAFAAMGSALGSGAAGQAAVGAWKKCFAQNKPAPMLLVVFVALPLTQIIYGMILMNAIRGVADPSIAHLGIGLFGGIAMGMSALFQGKTAAGACDAFADTGKGFVNYILACGMIETVALFVMVFLLGTV
ncbi:MAG: V-type ATP synthase subunit K [Spirochaetia bacterium]